MPKIMDQYVQKYGEKNSYANNFLLNYYQTVKLCIGKISASIQYIKYSSMKVL